MARYIDADKMREDWLENGENEYVYDTNAILDSIDAQPTADVVEVPCRCKNCKKKQGEINGCGDVYCSLHEGYFDKDAFCSYGERRTDNDL